MYLARLSNPETLHLKGGNILLWKRKTRRDQIFFRKQRVKNSFWSCCELIRKKAHQLHRNKRRNWTESRTSSFLAASFSWAWSRNPQLWILVFCHGIMLAVRTHWMKSYDVSSPFVDSNAGVKQKLKHGPCKLSHFSRPSITFCDTCTNLSSRKGPSFKYLGCISKMVALYIKLRRQQSCLKCFSSENWMVFALSLWLFDSLSRSIYHFGWQLQ